MEQTATIFLALVFESTPFLLAGVLLSAVGGPWLERTLGKASMGTPGLGMLAGTSAGILLPMCDCGSRPLAHRLALAGRREFAVAFMVAAPVVNPIVVITTWLAFRDIELVALRLGLTVLIAIAATAVLVRWRGEIAVPGEEHHGGAEGIMEARWARVPGEALHEFFELFQFLVLGAAMVAIIQVFIDRSLLTATEGTYLSVAAMMVLAFLLSMCSSVDAFVVAGLGSGLGMGPILAFLVFGPVVNLKSMPIYARLFTLPTVLIIVMVASQIAFVTAVGVELRGW